MLARKRRLAKQRRQFERRHIGRGRLVRHYERKGWEVVDFSHVVLNPTKFKGCWAQLFVRGIGYVDAVRLW